MVSLIDNLVIVVGIDFVEIDFVKVNFGENNVVFVDNIDRVEDRFVDVVGVVGVVDIFASFNSFSNEVNSLILISDFNLLSDFFLAGFINISIPGPKFTDLGVFNTFIFGDTGFKVVLMFSILFPTTVNFGIGGEFVVSEISMKFSIMMLIELLILSKTQ